MFGHLKGSFTGAVSDRAGHVAEAVGVTLFLAEVTDLSAKAQARLLRLLEQKEYRRVGETHLRRADIRFVAASNVPIKTCVEQGRFREDLMYRLTRRVVTVPPLRERGDDVTLLATTFLERYATEARRRVQGFTREALSVLQAYPWPGNVRELENRVKRAVVMAEGVRISPADLELDPAERGEARPLRDVRAELERDTIQRALAKNRGNVSRTAAELGVSRPTLYGMMEKLGIARG
jgi:two-component system NtrC family response regulator